MATDFVVGEVLTERVARALKEAEVELQARLDGLECAPSEHEVRLNYGLVPEGGSFRESQTHGRCSRCLRDVMRDNPDAPWKVNHTGRCKCGDCKARKVNRNG